MFCKSCNSVLPTKRVYCSNKCQADFVYKTYIQQWKLGKVEGDRGINAKNISQHIRRYILEKFSNKCARCGWNKTNPYSGNIPLEIEHIDGDSSNNTEPNLILLCPNCHALTNSYKNANKGKGRTWRRLKYRKNIS
jgi:hypothetical protein